MSSTGDEWPPPVVIDLGMGCIKAGVAGCATGRPQCVVPAVVGRVRYPLVIGLHNGSNGASSRDNASSSAAISSSMQRVPLSRGSAARDGVTFVGDEALSRRGISRLTYLGEDGGGGNGECQMDWDALARLFAYTYRKLGTDPDSRCLLLAEPCLCPKITRENIARILFEDLQIPYLFFAIQGALALYATGLTSGLVLDCSDSGCDSVPVDEGSVLASAVRQLGIGGRHLTETLGDLLAQNGWSMRSSSERELTRQMKESLCYVALDVQKEKEVVLEKIQQSFVLPDGQIIKLGQERFLCAEPLFSGVSGATKSAASGTVGVADILLSSLAAVAVEKSITDEAAFQIGCAQNIVVAGGSSMFPGFGARLRKELQMKFPSVAKTKIICPPDRRFMAWTGGSILASMPSFQRLWVHRMEYDEFGPGILHRRCF